MGARGNEKDTMSEQLPDQANQLTLLQETALYAVCERYNVTYDPGHYQHRPLDGLPEGYVSGWVGGYDIQKTHPTIYVGCDPDGRLSS